MKRFTYIISALLFFTCISCEDTLTEKPDSYYLEDNYVVTNANVELAVRGVYDVLAKIEHYGQFEMAMPSSDDTYYIQGTGTDNTRRDIAHYNVTPTNQWIYQVWMYKYQGIERANYVLAGAETMDGYKEGDKQLLKLMAEARFLRALLAFDLVRYFGDVPFKTTYSKKYADAYQPRTNREEIYDVIVDDLNFAKEQLDWATGSTSPEKATQGAARGLLMRVLLQRAGYSLQMNGKLERPDDAKRTAYFDAVTKEWEAFEANGYHGFYNGGYEQLFRGFSGGVLNSKESIFEIAFFNSSGAKEDSGNWGTYNGPLVEAPGIKANETNNFMGRANAFFRVVPAWNDFFDKDDERKGVMVCTYQYKWDKPSYSHVKVENKNTKDWYPGKWRREWMPTGYKEPNNTDINYCFIRYADVVLMAAEAYNELNQTPKAWTLLNTVRTRANATEIDAANYASLLKAPKVYNLAYINDGDDAGKFRTALYWERGFELAFEGQRKWDLIRWGILGETLKLFNEKANSQMQNNYPAGKNFVAGKHELFPIPLDEIQINPKLEGKNNPGY